MAGGSRIVINDQGITISTNGKIIFQAGQHKFEGGQKVNVQLPQMPDARCQMHRIPMSYNTSLKIKKI